MSLTVLCPTRDPGPRVRAALEPLRAVADEIVVAVDSEAGEADLAEYGAVADRLLRFERGPAHSALSWLVEQCRGDWVLMVAGDEVVAPALIDALPDLIASRRAVQFAFMMHWLWPDADSWLSGTPWHPDPQFRLVRNDALTRFAGRAHELTLPVSPQQYVDLPVWHLSLLSGVDDRRAKVARNVRDRAGLQARGGGELNAVYYLPEDARPRPVVRPVPALDREAIRRVQLAGPSGPPAPVAAVPLGTRTQIEARWAQRSVGDGAFRATVRPLVPGPLHLRRGERCTVLIHVRNDGDSWWPWGVELPPPFRLGGRWADGTEIRAAFPHEVPPGGEAIVPLDVIAPAASQRLVLDVLLEGVRWFGAQTIVDVEVG